MFMGIFVGLLAAFGASSLNVFLKQLSDFTPNFLSWVRFTAAAISIALIVTVFLDWEIPAIEFWLIVLFAKVPIEILLAYLTTISLRLSDLSIVGPISASFSSLFLVPVGYFVLGELPTDIGFIGVLSVVGGSFFLGEKKNGKYFEGLKNLILARGVWLAVLSAFLASVAISITKLLFHYAHPLLATFYATATLSIVLVPFALKQQKVRLRSRVKPIVGLWATSSISIALHNYGLSLMPAVYFISIKRLSMIFDVFFGKRFFKEEHVGERLIGASIMVLGVALIALD